MVWNNSLPDGAEWKKEELQEKDFREYLLVLLP